MVGVFLFMLIRLQTQCVELVFHIQLIVDVSEQTFCLSVGSVQFISASSCKEERPDTTDQVSPS